MNWNELFTYEEATGNLIWKMREGAPKMVNRFNKHFAGMSAGVKGYATKNKTNPRGIVVRVRGHGKANDFYAHRIVWEMHNGVIPDGMVIDHINGNPFDNRMSNIRLATRAQNVQNMRVRPGCQSGLKGVYFDKHRQLWQADIIANGVRVRLGRYQTKGLAAVARAKAAIRYHGEFARFA